MDDLITYLCPVPRCMSSKKTPVYWHFLAVLAFLVVPVLVSPKPPDASFLSQPALRDLFANILMLIIFYLNFYLLIPRLYFRDKHLLYGVIVVAGLLLISIVPSQLAHLIHLEPDRNPPPFGVDRPLPREESAFMHIQHNVFLYAAVILSSLLLRIRTRLFDTEVLRQHAEIGSLKSRINPHFLFNTLNNIYALAIREHAQGTASGLLKLSAMMRYVVTETVADFVPLHKEITYTNDYIDLQKMRLTSAVALTYQITGDPGEKKIAPVILMPFIENAFKHGVNPDQDSYIKIRITIGESSLELVVENKKVTPDNDPHVKSGVGIENTKERLKLLYPDKHLLQINEDQNTHTVRLILQLL